MALNKLRTRPKAPLVIALEEHRGRLLALAKEHADILQQRRMRRVQNLLRGKLDTETLDAVERIMLGDE